jgi:alkane 1-monooxygenase
MKRLGYLVVFLIPLAGFLGGRQGGVGVLSGVALAFVVIPVLDALLGLDPSNPSEDEARRLQQSPYLRALPFAWIPVQLALLGWALGFVGHLSTWEVVGLTLSLGVTTGGIGITVAHELGHKPGRAERAGALVLLASVSYLHFFIEHNRGHHLRVATPADPATSRLGESFWRFLGRTVPAQWRSAWGIERELLARRGLGPASWRNRMLWFAVTPVAITAALGATLGGRAAAVFVAQSVIAFSLLEAVNYIEHYGLVRRELSAGKYEPVTHLHSWNSSHRLTNWVLFHLQRHSDHHAHAARRYPALRHFDDSPQLPAGYASMVLLALVPPLWRRVMDPRVPDRGLDPGRAAA